MISVCIIEVLGYVGRIMNCHNPFSKVREVLSGEAIRYLSSRHCYTQASLCKLIASPIALPS